VLLVQKIVILNVLHIRHALGAAITVQKIVILVAIILVTGIVLIRVSIVRIIMIMVVAAEQDAISHVWIVVQPDAVSHALIAV
jgi:hypothetical protein